MCACRSVHRSSPPAGNTLLMSVLQGLTSLPEVPQLQYTAALTLAAYADWLADSLNAGHTANVPDLLQSLMRGMISFVVTLRNKLCLQTR